MLFSYLKSSVLQRLKYRIVVGLDQVLYSKVGCAISSTLQGMFWKLFYALVKCKEDFILLGVKKITSFLEQI